MQATLSQSGNTVGPIGQAITQLLEGLQAADNAMTDLETRMDRILKPNPSGVSGPIGNKGDPSSRLATEITAMARQTQMLVHRIRSIIDRSEL